MLRMEELMVGTEVCKKKEKKKDLKMLRFALGEGRWSSCGAVALCVK